jgi:4-amino-4-deoxy-L-arabinose transferase-like glycosyltransferase
MINKLKIQISKIKNKELIILILLSGILFFFKLGSFSLYDAAETTYGEFIKQIRLTGDWITMHYNGEIIFDKPPLYFWLATLATFVFGFNEFAIRFWAALSGVLTVVVTFYLGRSFYNQKVGFLSGIIAMTAFQFMIQSRIAELDIVLTLLLTSAFLFFWYGYQTKKRYFYWFFYAAMALATLIKGLVGIALPITAIFLFLLIRKELDRIKEMQILPGIIIILLIGAPWYIAEWYLHGQEFVEFALGFLFLSRFGRVVSGHPGPWYYYFFALLLGFAPWSHFLPYSLWRTWKNRIGSFELLSLCYIIPVILVFSIAKTKLPSYILPLYPFLAIMVGKLWDDFLGNKEQRMRKGMSMANIFLAVVAVLIIIGFAAAATNYTGQYEEFLPRLFLLAGVLVAGCLISIFSYFFRAYKVSFVSLPVMVFAIALILTTLILPGVEELKGAKPLGQEISNIIEPGQKIAAFEVGNRPSVVLHSPKPVRFLKTQGNLKAFLTKKEGYVFTTVGKYEKIKNSLPKRVKILDRKGDLLILYKP